MVDQRPLEKLLARLKAVGYGGVDFDCEITIHTRNEIIEAERACAEAADAIEKLMRGEFICNRCGLRKDGEIDGQPSF